MKGKLIQILNVDEEPIGLFYTEDETITSEMLVDWFRDYDDSDKYNEEGVDGFDDYVSGLGYEIERVFTEEETI